MERLIQYLDELDDLFYAVPLISEQVRRVLQRVLFLLGLISLQIVGVILALNHPLLALTVVSLLLVVRRPHYAL